LGFYKEITSVPQRRLNLNRQWNVGGGRESHPLDRAEICCMLTLFWSYRSLGRFPPPSLPMIIARCGRKWCRQFGCTPYWALGFFFPFLWKGGHIQLLRATAANGLGRGI